MRATLESVAADKERYFQQTLELHRCTQATAYERDNLERVGHEGMGAWGHEGMGAWGAGGRGHEGRRARRAGRHVQATIQAHDITPLDVSSQDINRTLTFDSIMVEAIVRLICSSLLLSSSSFNLHWKINLAT